MLKDKGGVDLVNFKKKNEALLMKYLDKFYNKADIPWVSLIWTAYYSESVPYATKLYGSFWWRDVFKLVEDFRAISSVKLDRAVIVLFSSMISGISMEVQNHRQPYNLDFSPMFWINTC
jgi:hypothetical protein